jgi:adenosylhomocysteine nucleosidase
MNIAIAAAHAMEFSTFRRYMGRVQKLPLGKWQHYIWQYQGNRVILLETGMGPENARGAAKTLLQTYKVDCMVNFGSAGMINEELKVGDAFLVKEITEAASGKLVRTNRQMTEAISAFLNEQDRGFACGRLLTSPEPVVRRAHRQRLAEQFMVGAVDMEAYALAEVAATAKFPFAALKMISDRANALTRLEYWKNLPQVDRKLGKLMYGFLGFLKAA